MPSFIFRCPNTGFHVQGLTWDEDESEGAGDDVFVGVTSLVGRVPAPSTRRVFGTFHDDGRMIRPSDQRAISALPIEALASRQGTARPKRSHPEADSRSAR